MELAELQQRNTDWILVILVISFLAFLIARINSPERVREFFHLPWHVKSAELSSEFNPLQSRRLADFLMSLAALLVTAVTIYLLKQVFAGQSVKADGWHSLVRIIFVLGLFILFKSLLGTLMGAIFNLAEPIAVSQNRFFAYLAWLAIPFFPIAFLLNYQPQLAPVLAYATIALALLGLSLALFRTAQIIISLPPKIGYNILYLCALEIIPIMYLVISLQLI